MEFERASKYSQRLVRFETDKETGFHEAIVARKALGSSVARYRTKLDQAYAPGRLGVRISVLQTVDVNADGEAKPIPSEMKMTKGDATILINALQDFINDTPSAIASAAMGDPSNCNIRVVEGMLAQNMLDNLTEEFGPPPTDNSVNLGFGPNQ